MTGAAGFIGSNLVKRLMHDVKNIKVIGIDSITDYYDVNIKYERLKEIEALQGDWSFVHASIADKDAVEKIFTENKIAVVVNLAAQAGIRYSITNPDAYIQSNNRTLLKGEALGYFAEWYTQYYSKNNHC